MKVRRLEVRNFRSLSNFDLDVDGETLFVIGENGGGKSSLLTALARSMGRDLGFTRADFADPELPVEIRVVLTDLDAGQQGVFAAYANFGAGVPTLTLETFSVWDPNSEEAETEHRYPTHRGTRTRKEERDAIPLLWLPANRDVGRILSMGSPTNLMGRLLETLPIQTSLDQAVADIGVASARLAADTNIAQLLEDGRQQLAALVPDVQADAFSLGISAITSRDLLRQLELVVSHLGEPVAIERQSSGIAQLAVFVFAIMLAQRDPGRILLIDEPEVSLHPQAQRSLMTALAALNSQMIVATHSPSLLDRADPRSVMRLRRVAGAATVARSTGLSAADATRLARFTTPQAAEAFFARSVILVEGLSDMIVIEALADRQGRNLDAEGIAIVPVGGAGSFGVYNHLFGTRGLELRVAGLCDEREEGLVDRALIADGHPSTMSRRDREALGFFVCAVDLEEELLRAIGETDVQRLITTAGDGTHFATYQNQPAHRTKTIHDQLHGFLRTRKVEYAPLLADAVNLAGIPGPMAGLLAYV